MSIGLREAQVNLRLFDAHNHLQDVRLAPCRTEFLRQLPEAGLVHMVVNGTCEDDWPQVLALAKSTPYVIPSFGYHPWRVKKRSANWQTVLTQYLDAAPAAVGEMGLDAWIKDHDLAEQREVFVWQLRLAARRNLPASIHCLEAWDTLLEALRSEPRPSCGFLLHSFGGPQEMIEPLVELGAYFSLPGYFAHERKLAQREAFLRVPSDRLLIETDAPSQALPANRVEFPLPDAADGRPVNHPANLGAVYRFASELLGIRLEALTHQVERNFNRIFGAVALKREQG